MTTVNRSRCADCGYHTGLKAGRSCPECGVPLQPLDAESGRSKRPVVSRNLAGIMIGILIFLMLIVPIISLFR